MAHRLQTLFLTLLLILGLTVFPVFAEEDDGSWDGWNDNGWYDDIPEEETEPDEVIFPDVQPGSWYYKDVMALYDARVIDGFKNGTFQPESTVTTGQALKMILLAAGYGEPERVASHWARGYLNLALDEGILERGEITDLDVTILRSLVAKVAAKALHLERQPRKTTLWTPRTTTRRRSTRPGSSTATRTVHIFPDGRSRAPSFRPSSTASIPTARIRTRMTIPPVRTPTSNSARQKSA